MDTAKLKKMAQYIRKELISIVTTKLETVLLPDSIERRESKNAIIALEGLIKEIGKEQVVEKVAYTWFNRFCALRYMEVNKYTKINVVSPIVGQFQPEVLAEAKMGYIDDSIVPNKVIEKIKGLLNNSITSKDPQGEAYKLLIIAYCNYYNQQMPFLFEKINDYTELLMPDDLISGNSVIAYIREALTPENCSDIEVIGWLYQYYISEKKDEVFADLKKGKKISKENVPAATQIFTPKWIVSYMVENSVGKLWLESHPDERLQSQFKYYLESAEQEDEVKTQLEELKNKDLKPQDIKVLDPACGSGHILVTAFSVLFEIYKSQGWQENEIPEMILKHNLYGLDICDRAAQLTQFAIMMKAREYDRNIFNKVKDLNVCSIKDTNWLESYVVDEILLNCNDKEKAKQQIELLQSTFKDAKEYGSILEVKDIDFDFWNEYLDVLKQDGQIRTYTPMIKGRLPYTLKQARIMQQKYECVIANPPYMGRKSMNNKLISYVKTNYPNSWSDLFAVFFEKSMKYATINGFISTINQHVWMFLSTYEKLRNYIYENIVIDTMLHLGFNAFETLGVGMVQSTTYVCKKYKNKKFIGKYCRLLDYNSSSEKEEAFLKLENIYFSKIKDFDNIIGSPVAYWLSTKIKEIFTTCKPLGDSCKTAQGLATANNDLFLRLWTEINYDKIGFCCPNRESSILSKKYWFPLNKGGECRKWYGNNDYVVDWYNDGEHIKEKKAEDLRLGKITPNNSKCWNQELYFKKSITWTLISLSFGVRASNVGSIFDVSAHSIFANEDIYYYLLSLLNTPIAEYCLAVLNPTLNYSSGVISNIPLKISTNETIINKINNIAKENVKIAKDDWDSFETSWDFEQHPLIRFKTNNNLKESFNAWKEYKEQQFKQLKANEEELNRLFIEIYGLQDEMTPDVADKDITVALADEVRDIKSLLSYAVGCMFGRYSLDEKGLIFAGGEFDKSKYKTLEADEDAVIPVLAEHMFSDDITSRFKDFLKAAFGKENFEENLEYVACVLGKKNTETADDTIRNYFMKDFYKDHIQMYQKRPIYWMFSSAKGNFNALVYMHRYNKDTASVILNSYLRNYRDEKLSAKISQCKHIETSASSSQADKIKASKEREIMEKIVSEVNEYERDILYPLATERKEIDLDDGVKVNYLKFGKALKNFGLKAK